MKELKWCLILVVAVAALGQQNNSQAKTSPPKQGQAKIKRSSAQPATRAGGGQAETPPVTAGAPEQQSPSQTGKDAAKRAESAKQGVWDDTDIVHVKAGPKPGKGAKAGRPPKKARK